MIVNDDSGLAGRCNAKDYGEHCCTKDQGMFGEAQNAVQATGQQ